MPKPIATADEIARAVRALLDRGIWPSAMEVRNVVGGGSMTTITSALAQWRGNALPRLATLDDPPPGVPQAVWDAGGVLWATAEREAAARFEERDRTRATEVADQIERAAAAVAAADAKREAAEQERGRLVDRLDALEENAASLGKTIAFLQAERDGLQAQLRQSQGSEQRALLALGSERTQHSAARAVEAQAHHSEVSRLVKDVDRVSREAKDAGKASSERERALHAELASVSEDYLTNAKALQRARETCASEKARADALDRSLARWGTGEKRGKGPPRARASKGEAKTPHGRVLREPRAGDARKAKKDVALAVVIAAMAKAVRKV